MRVEVERTLLEEYEVPDEVCDEGDDAVLGFIEDIVPGISREMGVTIVSETGE